jgi:toxin FitB
MSLSYLLDTNVISEMRKPKPHGAVSAWLESLSPDDIRIPAVAIAELQNGAEITRRQSPVKAVELESWIDRILATFAVLPMDGPMFRDWARLMVGRQSHLAADAMIAATARAHRLTIATRNVKDFIVFGVQVFNPFEFKGDHT